ncbi:MAG: hypothetical protein LC792_12975 [Actinobacteria bacterium]|nr:hypothetical protein [Actinomycetota bacterium]
MPEEIHLTGANEGTDHSTIVDLGSLTAHLASLDLDPATLELLMAVLTVDVSDPVEAANR